MTVKERTCSDPTRWKWMTKQCRCAGCKAKNREYNQSRYVRVRPQATADQIAQRDRRRERMILSGKATICPICLDLTARKSGFCPTHEPEEARL